jgi:hypothetical protein
VPSNDWYWVFYSRHARLQEFRVADFIRYVECAPLTIIRTGHILSHPILCAAIHSLSSFRFSQKQLADGYGDDKTLAPESPALGLLATAAT